MASRWQCCLSRKNAELRCKLAGKKMVPPWYELKEAESAVLIARLAGTLRGESIVQLQKLFEQCKDAPDADEAICFHGVQSLTLEYKGELSKAIEHRRTEIEKIRYLHQLARENPGDRAALRAYGESDLERRFKVLYEMENRCKEEGA